MTWEPSDNSVEEVEAQIMETYLDGGGLPADSPLTELSHTSPSISSILPLPPPAKTELDRSSPTRTVNSCHLLHPLQNTDSTQIEHIMKSPEPSTSTHPAKSSS